ncbi:hypothetical protein M2139_001901 [Enterococcus sp. PF1-24]|uniref:hypothetical protein n=1 Tax=unclassified Enterococcus TaxID=2608891 RepID=UPI002475C276|nr:MULTISPECIES: hypothetical protein [unclassified Enterococcus]MDH6364900.1 hypothetical protein [Enterococcus sp. PFB1-1]MDH6402001.1 hypothetical protein [Enterococcus sp. PF1-24]
MMKKIAFVLYGKQLVSVTYIGGLPYTKDLEKKLQAALADTYEVTFKWEEALKNQTVDALIIPEPFMPILNEGNIPEIKVPAHLLLDKQVVEVKRIIDEFFY